MNSTVTTDTLSPAPAAVETRETIVTTAEVDRSSRAPVLLMFVLAAVWFWVGSLLGMVASIKMHAPDFLSDVSWLTYGRVRPAATNAVVFGFASQAGMAVALWLVARLGRNLVQGALFIVVAVLAWNVGVALGVGGVLMGDGTGYECFEFPGYSSAVLLVGYLIIGAFTLITFHGRTERRLYPSMWYVMAALCWFPWVYATVQLLLIFSSVRGVLQIIVAGWAGHNLMSLWLAPLVLAAAYYFMPKAANKPLHSRALAVFGFWLLAIFGAYGGIPAGTPVPRWVAAVSDAGLVLGVTAVLAFATNVHLTLQGVYARVWSDSGAKFFIAGCGAYLVVGLIRAISVIASIGHPGALTITSMGTSQLFLLGFVSLVLVGAIYSISPQLSDRRSERPSFVGLNFWLAGLGAILVSMPLIIGGFVQGQALDNPALNFIDVVRKTVPFMGIATLGSLLVLVGATVLLVNVCRFSYLSWCSCCISEKPSTRFVKISGRGA
ncbi:MAG: hypothetical protein EXS30_00385 [Pedosphaera sp.]|nr:hypothetical protein [Pedosphaera sp.]